MTKSPSEISYLIVGAGPVGLAHAKALKLANMPYHQVDADDNLGGNWYHGVYENAHLISPRAVMEYPDFPMPAEYPEFPSAQNMLEYYNMYADHFGVREGIEFNKKVIYIRPIENNLWQVFFQDNEVRVYKAVLLCNGHHWDKRSPEYKGHFDGEMMHSKDYKRPDQLRGKRIVVVGAGNSACDVASESARVGKKAFMSIRSSAWFLPKLIAGQPLTAYSKPWVPNWIQKIGLHLGLRLVVGDLKNYGLPTPDHKVFEKHPTIGTEVLHYIKHGRIKPKPGIERLEGKKVIFTDGTEEEIDLIVNATGFHLSYPFLPKELNRVKGVVAETYGNCMIEDYKGIYLVGWEQARGGVGALVTPWTDLFVRYLKLEDEIQVPLGFVLKTLGFKSPTSHLFGLIQVVKNFNKMHSYFGTLTKEAHRINKENPTMRNKVLPMPAELNENLEVF